MMHKSTLPTERSHDVLIVGAGLAGLSAALGLAEVYRIALVTKDDLLESNTRYAQGGIAAVVDVRDSVEAHIEDTMISGAGLCDLEVVEECIRLGPGAVKRLIERGVDFDRTIDGQFDLGREGGHSHRRILHVGDATGYAIVNPLVERALNHPNIDVFTFHTAVDLIRDGARVVGAVCVNAVGDQITMFASHTILATGGCGQVFQRTTNPTVATGDGLALAIRSGAAVRDLEFYQFHPTCLALDAAPRFLVSEALRGEGGRLLDHCGDAFMSRYDKRADLAPRDIVARAIHQEMTSAGGRPVFLDMTHLSRDVLSSRFPSVFGVCMNAGLDISTRPIPVSPAAHYACGGIRVDTHGNTTIEGLSAVGEVACTGLHGANRLASNSLLEAVVYAERIVAHLKADRLTPVHSSMVRVGAGQSVHRPIDQTVRDELLAASAQLKTLMWTHASILRSGAGLALTFNAASALSSRLDTILESYYLTRELAEIRHMSVVSMQMVRAAQRRKKSVGLHYRTDV